MRGTFINFGCAGVEVVTECLLKFVEVLFILFFFLEALGSAKWE
jgi:hypothetical protein